MKNLRQKMAENGFESNESYDYIVKCLKSTPGKTTACLNIEGETGRHKTAFANAMAYSLDADHVLYHDFTQEEELSMPVSTITPEDDDGKQEPPISALDRILSDTCAFSEAEKTILILDQLQAANFKHHIRLYKFLLSHEWSYNDATFYANKKNLILFIISEEPVYHSLQKYSFKVWVNSSSNRDIPYKPGDFQLGPEAGQMMNALNDIFNNLKLLPTYSEYKKIIHDIKHNVHTLNDLCASIYGWTEGIDRNLLYAERTQSLIKRIMPIIEDFIGIEEEVELTAAHIPDESKAH